MPKSSTVPNDCLFVSCYDFLNLLVRLYDNSFMPEGAMMSQIKNVFILYVTGGGGGSFRFCFSLIKSIMVSSKTLSFIIMEEEVIAFTKWVPGVQKIKNPVNHQPSLSF